MTDLNKLMGSLVGLAVGDAVGTTVEFKDRDTFPEVTDMTGGGPFGLPVGYWTDDTSMALCLADSLLVNPLIDKADLLTRFLSWYERGTNSSTGRCFDIGNTTRTALYDYKTTGSVVNNTQFFAAGNGSIMRLAPVAIRHHSDLDTAITVAVSQSETTHACTACMQSCELLTEVLIRAFNATSKDEVIEIVARDHWLDEVQDILWTLDVDRTAVSSSGHVIATLHASLWCFMQTDTFRDAILLAANLGDDADTVAAVTGQIAGAYYGFEAIPEEWRAKLLDLNRFVSLVEDLSRHAESNNTK